MAPLSRRIPRIKRRRAGGGVGRLLPPRDSAEYTLRVAAKKTINNSTVDGKAGFSEYKNYPTRAIATLQGYAPAEVKLTSTAAGSTSRPRPRAFSIFDQRQPQ